MSQFRLQTEDHQGINSFTKPRDSSSGVCQLRPGNKCSVIPLSSASLISGRDQQLLLHGRVYYLAHSPPSSSSPCLLKSLPRLSENSSLFQAGRALPPPLLLLLLLWGAAVEPDMATHNTEAEKRSVGIGYY